MSEIYFDRNQDIKFEDYFERQLGTNWCWAACATSLYNYGMAVYGSVGNDDYSSTVQEDIVSLQKAEATYEVGDASYLLTDTLNFQSKVYNSNDWDCFYDYVVAAISNNEVPVLVEWAQDNANSHTVIICGYNSANDSFIIMDPQQYGMLSVSSLGFSVSYAVGIAPPSDKTFPMNPLYNELLPDDGLQNFYVENNKCSTKMSLATTIISNGKTYTLAKDFSYYIRITKEEDYTSSPYLGTSVKIERTDGHSYKQWLHYGNLLTKGKKNLKITKTSYDDVYGYQLNNFWVQFVPVAYLEPFTPTT